MTRTLSLVLLAAMLAACKPAAKPADTAAAQPSANAEAAASAAQATAQLEPGVPKAEPAVANPLQGQVDALNKAKGVEGNLQSQADERQKAIDAAAAK